MKQAILKYHGGKHKIAPWIVSHFPLHKCYAEPFGGGAAVLLHKKPAQTEVYNDLDSEVFNVFKTIREHGLELSERLALTVFSRDELKLAYQPTDCKIEAARRFIVRSHMGISTTSQHKNTGFRAAINVEDYCSKALTFSKIPSVILKVRERFNRVIIENCDAFSLFSRYDKPETLWYMDPPYTNDKRSKKSVEHGYAHNFSDDQQVRLCSEILKLKGTVILSGYDNDIYNDMLPFWTKLYRHSMNDARKKTTEVLWMNFKNKNLFNQ